ncbi:putative outer membrane protein [Maribacter sp. HTCC2170]|nr:putative outer membrane protein [Maribacter sp. HTCC2170]
MMKMKTKFLILVTLNVMSFNTEGLAQSEALTSSPYSLYGLGIINQTSIGKSNGIGYTGIGLKTETEINNLNPANFSLIPKNSFFYDMGISYEHNNYSNTGNNETRKTFNFSNLALAFRITDGLGAGFVMVPYSDVGYSLVGIQTNIEGTNETFESNVTGLGGLNDLKFNLGYEVTQGLRLGASASFLFGNIEEDESFLISNSSFQLNETTNYSGVRLGLGMQYDINKDFTFGSTIQFPTSLSGNLKRSVLKNLDGSNITVEDNETDNTADFNIPLELGFGLSAKFLESLTLSADYKKNFWETTGQTENLGEYTDQNIYAFGLEYLKNPYGFKYGERIRYRAGFNYDNGYLSLNKVKIDGFNITAGVGFPINRKTNSIINLSYGYGSKGQIQNILVKEDYHLITINFSLEDIWFKKRKIY